MRLIDADALMYQLQKKKDFGELTAKEALRTVKQAPTIDLVRCRECVFQRLGFCRFWQEDITESDYCSYGERRTE